MSIATEAWRQALDRATDVRKLFAPLPALDAQKAESSRPPLPALVQCLFFSPVRRTHILFAGADRATPVASLCERVGRAVAEISRANVLIVNGDSTAAADRAKTAPDSGGSLSDRESAVQPIGNVWEISLAQFEAESAVKKPKPRVFDYLILGADISDPPPPLCERCDGAVLVVTANRTRRGAAVRAKEILLGWNVELLGAVLEDRKFPVPECIYRRL